MALDLGTLYYTIEANTRPLQQASQTVDRASRRMGSALSGVTRAATSLQGILLGIGAGYAAKQFVDAASKAEQLRVQLETLTGRGTETFQKLNEWAAMMPVNTEKAIDVFKRLQAMGLDPTLKTMTRLTDASMALTGSTQGLQQISRALGQISVKGKVSAEELNQLAEAGYNAREALKRTYNLTADDFENLAKTFREKGISANEVVTTLLQDMEKKFGGTSQALADSWSGLVARMQHQWWNFRRDVMSSGPFQVLKESFDELLSYLETKQGQLQLEQWAKETGRAFISAFEAATMAAQGFLKTLNRAESLGAAFYQQMLELSSWTWGRRIAFEEQMPFTDEEKVKKMRERKEEVEDMIKTMQGFGTQQLVNNQEIEKRFQSIYQLLDKAKTATADQANLVDQSTDAQKQHQEAMRATIDQYREWQKYTDSVTEDVERQLVSFESLAKLQKRITTSYKDIAVRGKEGVLQAQRTRAMAPSGLGPGSMGGADDPLVQEQMRQAERTRQMAAGRGIQGSIIPGDAVNDQEMIDKLNKVGEEAKSTADMMEDAFSGWANRFSSQLTDMVWEAEFSFDKILESFGKMITQMLIQQQMVNLFGVGQSGWGAVGQGLSAIFSAQGNVFQGGQNLQQYAKGGVVDQPTVFPMAQGAGVMGEAGPEAVMPLKRTKGGDLGVKAQGGGAPSVEVNVINRSGEPVDAKQDEPKFDGQKYILNVVLDAANRNKGGFGKNLKGALSKA